MLILHINYRKPPNVRKYILSSRRCGRSNLRWPRIRGRTLGSNSRLPKGGLRRYTHNYLWHLQFFWPLRKANNFVWVSFTSGASKIWKAGQNYPTKNTGIITESHPYYYSFLPIKYSSVTISEHWYIHWVWSRMLGTLLLLN